MQFVDEFMWSHRLNGKWPLERIVDTGLRVNVKQSQSLQKSVKSMFEQGLQSHSAFQQELAYQARAFGRNMSRGSADVVAAVEEGSSNVVTAIQQMSDYLGSGLCEIRWAVERQNDTSLKILRVLIESLDNMSRQYFEQGIKWYENREYDLAKERFNKALEANMTNYFAYQYLGFISVAENDSNHAIRNFDLAQKIAETPYHRALALSHLARSYHAKDDLSTAADLTREATEIDPETAKFWYEFGGYSARLGRREESIAALNEAIEKDWTYFTVVVVDSDFDRVRTYVEELLVELKQREERKARVSLDNLKRAIQTARKAGATIEISECEEAHRVLENQYDEGNVFVFRSLRPAAQQLHDNAFHIAETVGQTRIVSLTETIRTNDRTKYDTLQKPNKDLFRLNESLAEFRHKGNNGLVVGGAVAFIVGLFIESITISSWIEPSKSFIRRDEALSQAALTVLFILPFGFALVIGLLVRRARGTSPRKLVEEAKRSKEREIEFLMKGAEADYIQKAAELNSEMSELEESIRKCRSKEYL